MLWFTIWFMVILKIPALYLAYVIWWAVKDPPGSGAEPALATAGPPPAPEGPRWRRRTRRATPRRGPHGSPPRRGGGRRPAVAGSAARRR